MKLVLLFSLLTNFTLASVIPSGNKANTYMIEAHEETSSEINEQNFHQIIGRAVGLYTDLAREQDRNLVVKVLDWQFPYFSAWARYEEQDDLYTVNFWGGFARIPGMTERGFALTVCHELGHILGGAPFHKIKDSEMMSAEGQSDYFASALCLKRYHYNFPFPKETDLDPYAAAKCFEKFKDEDQQDFCFQTAKAGSDLSVVLAFIASKDVPQFETPQSLVVEETLYNSYPHIQCRLDTYLAGALSTYDANLDTIIESQDMRPKCWFKGN
jgi:hypothetical protein